MGTRIGPDTGTIDPPEMGVDETPPSSDGEFFIPDGNIDGVGNYTNRFVKNPLDPRGFTEVGTGNDSYYYWTSEDQYGFSIMSAGTLGGSAHVVERLTYRPSSLTADDAGYVWSDAGRLFAHNLSEPLAENIQNFAAPVSVINLDTDFVYVGTVDGDIYQSDRGAGGSLLLTSASGVPAWMTRVDDSIFWATYAEGNDGGELYEYNLEKGTTIHHLSGFNFDAGVAVDDGNIYWADSSARILYGVDRFGGEPFTLASKQYDISSIAADRFFVYYATGSDGYLKAVPKSGGAVYTLSDTYEDVAELTVSGQRLFMVGTDNIFYLEL